MPGLEGDLEEWQTQEVNVTRGEAEGDIVYENVKICPFFVYNKKEIFVCVSIKLIFSHFC